MAITLRNAVGALPLNPIQDDAYEGYSQATAAPLQQGWHQASLTGDANSAYTEALKAQAAGDLNGFNDNIAAAQSLQQEAANWASPIHDFGQVGDLRSAMQYVGQGLGSAANSSLPSLLGGAAGGIGAAMLAARHPVLAANRWRRRWCGHPWLSDGNGRSRWSVSSRRADHGDPYT